MLMHARSAASAVLIGFVVLAMPAEAANITWSAPVYETGDPSDVLTTGTLVGAAKAGGSVTLNGVTFVGQQSYSGGTISFGSTPISVSGMDNPYAAYGATSGSWNLNYRQLVAGAAYGYETPTITLSGLTAGNGYTVQIFQPVWDFNYPTIYTGGANSSAQVSISGADAGAGSSPAPQYIIGTFVASGATQAITLSSPTAPKMFDAIQVRQTEVVAPVPEPATWGVMLVGFGMTGAAIRRRSRVVAQRSA